MTDQDGQHLLSGFDFQQDVESFNSQLNWVRLQSEHWQESVHDSSDVRDSSESSDGVHSEFHGHGCVSDDCAHELNQVKSAVSDSFQHNQFSGFVAIDVFFFEELKN